MPIVVRCDECKREDIRDIALMRVYDEAKDPVYGFFIPISGILVSQDNNKMFRFACSPDCAAGISKEMGIPFQIDNVGHSDP